MLHTPARALSEAASRHTAAARAAPDRAAAGRARRRRGGGGGGGSGGGGGGGGAPFGNPEGEPERKDREELIEQIVTIIQEQVDPEGWRDLGGDTGSLQELNGNLIITNTPRNHRAIEGLLNQLRTIRALQINVEARLLNVSMDWFEEIGLDLDLYFNTNDDMLSAAQATDPFFSVGDFFNDPAAGGGAGRRHTTSRRGRHGRGTERGAL